MTKPEFEYTNHHDFNWESDLISHIYYNKPFSELWVVMNGGRTYAYNGVLPETFQSFINAPSAGRFYNTTIRGSSNIYSLGFKGFDYDLKFVPAPSAKLASKQEFEVTVQVTLTTTVCVTADNFDSAAELAMDEVEKIQGFKTDIVSVTGVKKL